MAEPPAWPEDSAICEATLVALGGVWEDEHDEIQDDPCGGGTEGPENEKESDILATDAAFQLVSEPMDNMNQEKRMRDTGGSRHSQAQWQPEETLCPQKQVRMKAVRTSSWRLASLETDRTSTR